MALILRNGGSQSPDRWLKEPRNNHSGSTGNNTSNGQNGATTTASPKTTNANHANKKSTNGKVKTGDNNHMILYTVSLVLSLMIAAGCIYTIISKRRKNR